MRAASDIRVFFALWPDDQLREPLDNLNQRLSLNLQGLRRVPAANLHMTLHFIGNISLQALACMQKVAAEIKAEPFHLRFDHLGYFAKPKVLWLGCDDIPQALVMLQQQLGEGLTDCGFQAESRPFHPHLTLARKVGQEPQLGKVEPLGWAVDRFALIQSETRATGVEYSLLESYPL